MSAIEILFKKELSPTFEDGKKIEWLISNSIGSYSSSTILDLPIKEYHGFFSSIGEKTDFRRVLVIKEIKEILVYPLDGERKNQYLSKKSIEKFEYNVDTVTFHFLTEIANVIKKIKKISEGYSASNNNELNGFIITYKIKNKLIERLTFKVEILLPLLKNVEIELLNDHTVGISFKEGKNEFPKTFYTIIFSDKALSFVDNTTREGENIHFSLELRPNEDKIFRVVAFSAESKEKAIENLKGIDITLLSEKEERVFSSGLGVPIFTLLSTAKNFIVKRGSKLSVIAGYPFYGEIGRDAMISLPGLTLITGRFKEAELIFEHFLNNSTSKGIPSRFSNGKPIYEDFDSFLWLVDRLYCYMKYIGKENFKNFLHTYWWNLKDVMKNYAEKEREGLLFQEGKTWMLSEKRECAVEIQGLWYNSLKIMEKFSELMNDYDTGINYGSYAKSHEENFLEKFWNGSYLNDSLNDETLRPNQLIPLSLNFTIIPNVLAKKILTKVGSELLTSYGIMTLSKKDSKFNSKDKFNGAAVPWLIGPFIKAYIKFGGEKEKGYEFLKTLFEKHVNSACLGTISEFFDSETYEALGCCSYSLSVSELLRAYFEDIQGKKFEVKDKLVF